MPCEIILEVLSIVIYSLNLIILLHTAYRAPRTKIIHFWVSTAIFLTIGTVLYFHIVSDCSMIYVKIGAALLGIDLFILMIDSQVWCIVTV